MNNDFFEKTENYLSGNMEQEEKLQFEKNLEADVELRELFDTYRMIELKMPMYKKNEPDEAAFSNHLSALRADYFEAATQKITTIESGVSVANSPATTINIGRKPKEKTFFWKPFAIAAAIIGIMALGITWYLNPAKNNEQVIANLPAKTDSLQQLLNKDTIQHKQKPPDALIAQQQKSKHKPKPKKMLADKEKLQQLYASNFAPDAAPEEISAPLADAFYYYNNGRYKEAHTAIKASGEVEPTRGIIGDTSLNIFYKPYYSAQCLMANGQTDKAIAELKNALLYSPNKIYLLKTQWYLALAWLQTGETNKARILLQQIAANKIENEYAAKALALLVSIK